jgi:hypothetical protein
MKPISSEIVEKTWKKMARIPPREAQKMITLIGKNNQLSLLT